MGKLPVGQKLEIIKLVMGKVDVGENIKKKNVASRGNMKGGKKPCIRYIIGRVGYRASVIRRRRGSVSGGRESGRWLWECLSAAEVLAFDSLAKAVGLEDVLG